MRPTPTLIPRFLPARLPIPPSRPAEFMSAPLPYQSSYSYTYANTDPVDMQSAKPTSSFGAGEWFPINTNRKGRHNGYDHAQPWTGQAVEWQYRTEGRMKVEGMQGRVAGQRGMNHTLNRYHTTSAVPLHTYRSIPPPANATKPHRGNNKSWGLSPRSNKDTAPTSATANDQTSTSTSFKYRSVAQTSAPAEAHREHAATRPPTIYHTADGRTSTVPPPTIAWCDHLSMI